jgi:hypothetical protein
MPNAKAKHWTKFYFSWEDRQPEDGSLFTFGSRAEAKRLQARKGKYI